MHSKEHTYYRTLYEVTKVINSSLEPITVLNKIAEQVAKALGVMGCTIRLLDRRREFLLPSAFYGLSKGYIRKGTVNVDKSGIDKEVLEGKTVFIKDATKDTRFQYPDKAREEGFTSILVLPLIVEGGNVIGVIRVYSAESRDFDESDVEFLTIISNLSAIAIENARLHQALKSDYELLTAYNYQVFED